MSLDSLESRLRLKIFPYEPKSMGMLANQPYDPASLMRFQASLLSLGAALAHSAKGGSHEVSTEALVEVERMTKVIEPRSR